MRMQNNIETCKSRSFSGNIFVKFLLFCWLYSINKHNEQHTHTPSAHACRPATLAVHALSALWVGLFGSDLAWLAITSASLNVVPLQADKQTDRQASSVCLWVLLGWERMLFHTDPELLYFAKFYYPFLQPFPLQLLLSLLFSFAGWVTA